MNIIYDPSKPLPVLPGDDIYYIDPCAGYTVRKTTVDTVILTKSSLRVTGCDAAQSEGDSYAVWQDIVIPGDDDDRYCYFLTAEAAEVQAERLRPDPPYPYENDAFQWMDPERFFPEYPADMNVYVRLEGAASDAAGGGASDAAGSGGGGAVSGYGQDMDGVEAAGGEACHGMSEGASHGRKAVVRAVYKDGGYYDEKGCLLTGVTGWIHRYLNLAATISAPEYSGEDYIPPQDSLR